jgi:hypothetical protein
MVFAFDADFMGAILMDEIGMAMGRQSNVALETNG